MGEEESLQKRKRKWYKYHQQPHRTVTNEPVAQLLKACVRGYETGGSVGRERE